MDNASRRLRVGHRFRAPLVGAVVLGAALTLRAAGGTQAPAAGPPPASPQAVAHSFQTDVRPVLERDCTRCHNAQQPTAGFIVADYADPASLATKRDGWEAIVARLLAGEMPPPGEDGPSDDEVEALVGLVQTQFDLADRNATVDPGRVTAHRLNRVEYAHTIRDLLDVDFRTDEAFPADDSGYGFDNNGDVLTVSPALMQQYLAAAERIAARAVGGDPLPEPGIFTRRDTVRRVGDSAVELKALLEYDAEYSVRVTVTGHRGADDPPVTLVISVDGAPIKTVEVPVQMSAVNKQGGGTQRSLHESRVFLAGNEHVFRAEFVGDEGLKAIPEDVRRNSGRNIFPDTIEIAGPYTPADHHDVAKKALLCDPAVGRACVARIARTLARRAYRRRATAGELAELARVYDRARQARYSPKQSLQFMLAAMLVSPHFLFRIEHDPGRGRTSRITDLELASRLSYFLWSSMPDDQLLTLAEANRLHQPAVLEAQVARMIVDPKSSALADDFAGQWLETRSLDAVKRDPSKFPGWNAELRDAMREETRRFFDAVLRENRPISDFIDGRYTFLNERLAKHYGIPGVEGPEFRRVELTTEQRGGVFTQASVLTVSSYPTRTSVVLRGKFLLENALNAPVPPPPPDVPPLDEGAIGVARTLRAQMEQHRADVFCASCHSRMDPLGFGLENYDAVGRWRVQDGQFPIDASGQFPSGHTFSGPAEMKALLLGAMPEFTRGLAQKMLTYALGRGVEPSDRLAVKKLVDQTAAGGYRLQALVQAIVKSVPFQQRRGERPDNSHIVLASRASSGDETRRSR